MHAVSTQWWRGQRLCGKSQLSCVDICPTLRRQRRLAGLRAFWSRAKVPAVIVSPLEVASPYPHLYRVARHGPYAVLPDEVRAQARLDSDAALWRSWAASGDREEFLPDPHLKRAMRHSQDEPFFRATLGGGSYMLGLDTRSRTLHRLWTSPSQRQVRWQLPKALEDKGATASRHVGSRLVGFSETE